MYQAVKLLIKFSAKLNFFPSPVGFAALAARQQQQRNKPARNTCCQVVEDHVYDNYYSSALVIKTHNTS